MADLLKVIGDIAASSLTGKDYETEDLTPTLKFNSAIRSISSAAANTTYYFPLLVSKNVDPESAYLISDYLDTMYAYFVRAAAQQTKAIRIPKTHEEINVNDFLKKFHQNQGISGNVLRPSISFESAYETDFAAAMLQNETANEMKEYKMLSNKPLNEDGKNEVDLMRQINALKKYKDSPKFSDDVIEETLEKERTNAHNQRTADELKRRSEADKKSLDNIKNDFERNKLEGYDKAKLKNDADELEKVIDHSDRGYSPEDERYKMARDKEAERVAQRDAASLAKWNAKEVEKRNMSAQPLVVPLEITFLSGDHQQIPVNVGVGIKTLIHDIAPADIRQCVKDGMLNGKLKSFIQWTSGEVSSVGDLLFGIKDMKRAIGGNNTLRKWTDVVMRRKLLNKLTFGLTDRKPFLPNVTFVLSMSDVNAIKAETGVDLIKDIKYVYRIMKESMLLAFIVADEVNEKAYVMFDGHSSFDAIPYKAIERDTRKETKQFEQLLKVMAMR